MPKRKRSQGKKKKSNLIIVNNTDEKFTISTCTCPVCQAINQANGEWDSFEAVNLLQTRMKKVVADLEERYSGKKT